MLVKSKLKYIQSLGQKKSRDAENVFIAEGPKIIKELIEANGVQVIELYAVKEWIDANGKLSGKQPVIEVSGEELQKISQLTTANQVLAVIKKMDEPLTIDPGSVITLALETIQDPGNLGTIIRLADWFAVEQIVCSHDCADMYNPKVVQATMGSMARVKVLYTDLEQWLTEQKGVDIYATALEGQDIRAMKKLQEAIIIIGNESKGIQPGVMKLANSKITIPKKGKAESLNAAIATGIILSHIS
jgi:RNA methyltransferase, TrmH family